MDQHETGCVTRRFKHQVLFWAKGYIYQRCIHEVVLQVYIYLWWKLTREYINRLAFASSFFAVMWKYFLGFGIVKASFCT